MIRLYSLHPVLVDLKAKHKAEIDELKAKLEAAEQKLKDEEEGHEAWEQERLREGATMLRQNRKLAEALEFVCAEHSNTSQGYVEIRVEALGLAYAALADYQEGK